MTENLRKLLNSESAIRWLFYGDSITHGANHTFGKRDFSEHFREHVVWETQRRNDLVLNSAFSGYTLRELLRDFDFRAAAFRPHAAFIMIGCNDSVKCPQDEFLPNLQKLWKKFQEIDCLLILQTPTPIITQLDPRRGENLIPYPEMIRQFAAENKVDLIDHWQVWEKLTQQDRYYLMNDPIHPNETGHLMIAHEIFRYMETFSSQYPVCRMQYGPKINI